MIGRGNIGTMIGLGLLAEVVVFCVVAERIGFGSALLLTGLISVLGMVALKRSGASALASMRSMANQAASRESAVVDGMLGAMGGLLLVLPGFLTDLVGLVLLAPSGRQWVMRHLGAAVTPSGEPRRRQIGAIDLDAQDWRRIDDVRGS